MTEKKANVFNSQSPVVLYATSLFRNGLEVWNRETKSTSNVGGAQIFQIPNWRGPNSNIVFLRPDFEQAMKDRNAHLFSINRTELDANGNPKKTANDPTKNMRVDSGLMMLTASEEDAVSYAELIRNKIPDLQQHVAALVEIEDFVPNLRKIVSEYKIPGISSVDVSHQIDASRVIILAIRSSGPGSLGFWSLRRKTSNSTRAGLDSLNTLPSSGSGIDII